MELEFSLISKVNYCKMTLLLVFFSFLVYKTDYKMQTHHKIAKMNFMEDLILHYFLREKKL